MLSRFVREEGKPFAKEQIDRPHAQYKGVLVKRIVKQRSSQEGVVDPNDPRRFEVDEAMAARMIPLTTGIDLCHDHEEAKVVGKVLASYINPHTKMWDIDFAVYGDTPEGREAISRIEDGGMRGLSLQHEVETLKPIEVSLCYRGMRLGTWIHSRVEESNGAPGIQAHRNPSSATHVAASYRDKKKNSSRTRAIVAFEFNRPETICAHYVNMSAPVASSSSSSSSSSPPPSRPPLSTSEAASNFLMNGFKEMEEAAARSSSSSPSLSLVPPPSSGQKKKKNKEDEEDESEEKEEDEDDDVEKEAAAAAAATEEQDEEKEESPETRMQREKALCEEEERKQKESGPPSDPMDETDEKIGNESAQAYTTVTTTLDRSNLSAADKQKLQVANAKQTIKLFKSLKSAKEAKDAKEKAEAQAATLAKENAKLHAQLRALERTTKAEKEKTAEAIKAALVKEVAAEYEKLVPDGHLDGRRKKLQSVAASMTMEQLLQAKKAFAPSPMERVHKEAQREVKEWMDQRRGGGGQEGRKTTVAASYRPAPAHAAAAASSSSSSNSNGNGMTLQEFQSRIDQGLPIDCVLDFDAARAEMERVKASYSPEEAQQVPIYIPGVTTIDGKPEPGAALAFSMQGIAKSVRPGMAKVICDGLKFAGGREGLSEIDTNPNTASFLSRTLYHSGSDEEAMHRVIAAFRATRPHPLMADQRRAAAPASAY